MGFGKELKNARELVFTGQIYLYSERAVKEDHIGQLIAEATSVGQKLTFTDVEYVKERDKWQKPRAFISHDSRDKASIAEPLALWHSWV